MYKSNETLETFTARLFALQACVAAPAWTHPNRPAAAAELDEFSEKMRAQFLHSKLPDTALAAFDQTASSIRKLL